MEFRASGYISLRDVSARPFCNFGHSYRDHRGGSLKIGTGERGTGGECSEDMRGLEGGLVMIEG